MNVCRSLKGFCLKHEWASGVFALLGVSLLLASVWIVAERNVVIWAWISQNLLLHGVLFGAATLAAVLLIFGCLCLGFSECSEADKRCIHAYRGRRSRRPAKALRWVESLGKNPRRFRAG